PARARALDDESAPRIQCDRHLEDRWRAGLKQPEQLQQHDGPEHIQSTHGLQLFFSRLWVAGHESGRSRVRQPRYFDKLCSREFYEHSVPAKHWRAWHSNWNESAGWHEDRLFSASGTGNYTTTARRCA